MYSVRKSLTNISVECVSEFFSSFFFSKELIHFHVASKFVILPKAVVSSLKNVADLLFKTVSCEPKFSFNLLQIFFCASNLSFLLLTFYSIILDSFIFFLKSFVIRYNFIYNFVGIHISHKLRRRTHSGSLDANNFFAT